MEHLFCWLLGRDGTPFLLAVGDGTPFLLAVGDGSRFKIRISF
jgi:hypothetical protein